MSFSGAPLVLIDGSCRRTTTPSPFAALAVGLMALAIGVAPAAADLPDGDDAESTAVADTESRETDHRSGADTEDGERDAAERTGSAAGTDAGREVVVVELEPVQKCRTVRTTGSRLPKRVCTMVPQTLGDQAAEAAAEQRTRDYLRRRDDLSTRPDTDDNGLIRSGLFD